MNPKSTYSVNSDNIKEIKRKVLSEIESLQANQSTSESDTAMSITQEATGRPDLALTAM